MIRVNLLAQGPGAAPPREWVPREHRQALLGLGLLLVTVVGVGGWWWYLRHQLGETEVRIAEGEARLEQLKDAQKLLEAATNRKNELAERLALIDRLRAAKRAPISLLETVSRSVPEGLWLVEIKQTGTVIQVDGRAISLTSVSDFAEGLQRSGLFKMPVEILATTTEVVEENDVIRFSLKAEAATVTPPTTVVNTTPAGRPGV
jgi:type IV pilus assembly protein PilN